MKPVRPAAVAGLFYPDAPGALEAAVTAALAGAAPEAHEGPVKAVIAPHAGYLYSGAVAGCAFAALAPRAGAIKRVVVIGPSHFVWLEGIAVPSAGAFETPLGQVPVEEEAVAAIADLPQVRVMDSAHEREHALEVELPFLQHVLGDFALVPLVVGEAGPDEVAEVIERLWGGDETVIVVSSDLSHYHSDRTARRLDARTADAVERFAETEIAPEDACGARAIAGFLLAARRRGLTVERLAMANSGDAAGDRRRVVGYGAWAFREPARQ